MVSVIERDPKFRTDRLAGALVDFGGGRHLNFTCSTQLVPYQSVQALGTKGRVEIIIPFNAPQGEATTILVDSGLRCTAARPGEPSRLRPVCREAEASRSRCWVHRCRTGSRRGQNMLNSIPFPFRRPKGAGRP